VTERLFNAAYAWIGWVRGGLAIATVVASAAFGAVCGSGSATSATMTVAALPQMRKYKYDMAMSTGALSAGAVLGLMIPPSILFIVYGIVSENSIGALFLAGFLPGIMIMLLFSTTIFLMVWRHPTLGPAGPRVGWKQRLQLLGAGTFETVIVFLVVMGMLIMGICTPTEGGAIGAIAVLILGLARRQLRWQGIISALRETTRTTAMIYMLLVGVKVFGRFLAISQIPHTLADFATGLVVPRLVIMLGILLLYLFFGCFIDPMAFVLLTIPIFYPLILMLGYDPIWYGVMMVCVCTTGGMTPPVGLFVYVVAGIAKDVPVMTVFRGTVPFVVSMMIAFVLLLAFPQIATFLPSLFFTW